MKDGSLSGGFNRRDFIRAGSLAAALPAVSAVALGGATTAAAAPVPPSAGPHTWLEEKAIADMQADMTARRYTSRDLVSAYLDRIAALDTGDSGLRSIIELNPDALKTAGQLDRERRVSGPRSALHGIPIVVKDNLDTTDMMTTAGSLALVGPPPTTDSTVVARLRAAGAVILGKANLSEFANFRGFASTSGWSGRGGQCGNPYQIPWNPCGSSAGSAASVSGNLIAAAIGTETDGSIVCPASMCGVVGIKPSVGLVSRAGVIPISHTQDTVGPHGRTVADAAAMLGLIAGQDPRDPATAASAGHAYRNYLQFLVPNGLAGARIGVARNHFTGLSNPADRVFDQALGVLAGAGAVIVDPADIPTMDAITQTADEIVVLVHEIKRDMNAYLATRPELGVHTMSDLIAFNQAHASEELQFFGQEWFELADADVFSDADYAAALAEGPALAGARGIDAVLDQFNLDALVVPSMNPAWPTDLINGDHFTVLWSTTPAGMAGYPLVNVPAGYVFGLPVGLCFMGRKWSEPTLLRLAYGFEQASQARVKPQFLHQSGLGSAPAQASVLATPLAGTQVSSVASLAPGTNQPTPEQAKAMLSAMIASGRRPAL